MDQTYNSHENRGPGYVVCCMITITAACIVVCLRVYTRMRIAKPFKWDDYTIVLSFVRFLRFTPHSNIKLIYSRRFLD